MRTPVSLAIIDLARRLLDRLRDLGRRLGDAVESQLRPHQPRQVPVPVPLEDGPGARRPGGRP